MQEVLKIYVIGIGSRTWKPHKGDSHYKRTRNIKKADAFLLLDGWEDMRWSKDLEYMQRETELPMVYQYDTLATVWRMREKTRHKGKVFIPERKLDHRDRQKVRRMQDLPASELAERFNVSKRTIYRTLSEID